MNLVYDVEMKHCSRGENCINPKGSFLPISEFRESKDLKSGYRSACKECEKSYNKEWYENNKEYALENKKEWYKNNKEYALEYKKEWRENNLEYHRKRTKNDLPKAMHRKSFDANTRAIKDNVWGRIILQEMFLKAQCQISLFGLVCIYTLSPLEIGIGTKKQMVLEHINPKSNGGLNITDNLVLASNNFNRIKSSTPLKYFASHLIMPKTGAVYIYHDFKRRNGELDEMYNDLLPEYRKRYDRSLVVASKSLLPTIDNPNVDKSNEWQGKEFFDNLWISEKLKKRLNGVD